MITVEDIKQMNPGVDIGEEEWRIVPGTDKRYEVSNWGNVRSCARTQTIRRGKQTYTRNVPSTVLSQTLQANGYYAVWLEIKPKAKNALVHRLAARAFIPHFNTRRVVSHKDGNKLNNYVNNLEWVENPKVVPPAYNPDSLVTKTKICPICKSQFKYKGKQTYCKQPHTKRCVICGTLFEVPYARLSEYDKIVTCGSKSCAAVRRSKLMKATIAGLDSDWNKPTKGYSKTCKWCGKPFIASHYNKQYCDGEHYRNCVICNTPFLIPNTMLSNSTLKQTCSPECDKQFRINQNIAKYGAANFAQTTEWKQKLQENKDTTQAKRVATNRAKFGVDYPSQRISRALNLMQNPDKAPELEQFMSEPAKFISEHFIGNPTPTQLSEAVGVSNIWPVIDRLGIRDLVDYKISNMEAEVIAFISTLDKNISIVHNDKHTISHMN